jgi:DNA invertase Pin-like site-specific DNA recombinase
VPAWPTAPDDQQVDALTTAGVDTARVYADKLPGTSIREQRPGLLALLDYPREGDAIVVVGIDRLGGNAAEVMSTIRELVERGIVLRSLREGIDTANATERTRHSGAGGTKGAWAIKAGRPKGLAFFRRVP